MRVCTYTPPPPLSAFVNLFWLYEGYRPLHQKERVLPTGTIELVISLREDTLRVYGPDAPSRAQSFRGPLLCGAHSETFVIDTAQQEAIIEVNFQPGGAFPFLGLPAGELQNTHAPLDALWGRAAHDLHDRLREAKSPEEKFSHLEKFLLAKATRPLARRPEVAFALRALNNAPRASTIADITRQIGLSPKRFIQIFREEVGLSPKLFFRVQRFQEALRRIESGQKVSWADIAFDCGYFDQAHFIHDFKAFSGLNPTTYLARRSDHRNHIPIEEEGV